MFGRIKSGTLIIEICHANFGQPKYMYVVITYKMKYIFA